MNTPTDELSDVIHDVRTCLRVLRGFGVRALSSAQVPRSAASPGESPQGRARSRQQAHMFAPPPAGTVDLPIQPGPNPLTPDQAQNELDALRKEIGDCTRCRLNKDRSHIVFGEGHPTASLVLAGEGPGREEDRSGRPFVGPAGQLLDRILAAMGKRREEVYICNVVKCRPPENRTPEEDEMHMCGQFLTRQLQIIQPRYIIALGATAAKYLVGTNQSMSRMRGRFYPHPGGARILPTYHPAYLLRNASAKRDVWEDVQKVMAEMNDTAEERT